MAKYLMNFFIKKLPDFLSGNFFLAAIFFTATVLVAALYATNVI